MKHLGAMQHNSKMKRQANWAEFKAARVCTKENLEAFAFQEGGSYAILKMPQVPRLTPAERRASEGTSMEVFEKLDIIVLWRRRVQGVV
jgi:hypothetical protein